MNPAIVLYRLAPNSGINWENLKLLDASQAIVSGHLSARAETIRFALLSTCEAPHPNGQETHAASQ